MRSVGVDVPLVVVVVGAGDGSRPLVGGRDVEEADAGERRWCWDTLR